MSRHLVVVGDTLLDRDVEGRVDRLSPDAPVPVLDERLTVTRPGGAGLAAALAAGDGHRVTLVTALSRDPGGRELARLLRIASVNVIDLGLDGPTPEKIRFRSDRDPLLRLDRGGGRVPLGPFTATAAEAIAGASAVLVSDYGRGLAADPQLRAQLERLGDRLPVVWDPHPRGPAPVPGVTVATPNEAEALGTEPCGDPAARACRLREDWRVGAVCVTVGAKGARLSMRGGIRRTVPAPIVAGGDTCGAGDRFASRLTGALADGIALERAVAQAVRSASGFVEAGGAGSAFRPEPEVTTVATGGCFDLLHAGHVHTLEAARNLGDRLVVCLNSDRSVRRLKGPQRPIVSEDDRAAVLRSLRCVDSVIVFDEDTPNEALRRLKPDIWAKGGDYDGQTLPEEAVLREWGGRLVLLPYMNGRSTTRLIEEAVSCG